MTTKKCSTCKELKDISEFNRNVRMADGFSYICKKCSREMDKKYREKHPEKALNRKRRWNKNNREILSQRRRQKRIDNPEKVRDLDRISRAKWAAKHPDVLKAIQKRQYDRVMKTDSGKLKTYVRTAVRKSIRELKAGRHWELLVGYTLDDLKRHLEKQFKGEMTWDNYGTYWHIDHKIPVAAFNFQSPDDLDFRRCWALSNLQPLEAIKNLRKSDNIDRPFQPSLMMVA